MSKYVKQEVVRKPFKPKFSPSPEQEAFFELSRNTSDNIHLDAKAGSGKSTTIQWEMALDAERGYRPKAGMAAFNKSIVQDIEPRCAAHVTVKTFHSFGYGALAKRFGRLTMLEDKTLNILKEYKFLNPDPLSAGKEKMEVVSRLWETKNLVDKMKVCLVSEHDREAIVNCMYRFNIEIDKPNWIMEILPDVFQKICSQPSLIDFTDMMWLAIRLDLPIEQYEKLYVDECQDLNPLMLAYANKMVREGGRLISVGDKNQSIYSFAAADSNSIGKLVDAFNSKTSSLNTCYRCGSNIILEAQRIVPDIVAHHSTGEGVVNRISELPGDLQEGRTMILSRRNANLIRPCFRLLREGKKAVIKGRDIGAGLIRLIDQMKASSIEELVIKVDEWEQEKIQRIMKSPKFSPSLIEGTQDQAECLRAIGEECKTVDEMKYRIGSLFDENRKGITLSSIHRSKGLEADRVCIVDYRNVRLNHDRMTPEDHIQEANLEYVGLTRAKKQLDLVG